MPVQPYFIITASTSVSDLLAFRFPNGESLAEDASDADFYLRWNAGAEGDLALTDCQGCGEPLGIFIDQENPFPAEPLCRGTYCKDRDL